MAQRIDSHVHFAAIALCIAAIAGARTALAADLQDSAIKDDGAGLALVIKC